MSFEPKFTITPKIARDLMRIEAARQAVQDLPITPSVLATLRETARLFSTHYSTMIEGNRLTQEQVSKVVEKQEHFPGRERDEKEVLGYYAALEKAEQIAAVEEVPAAVAREKSKGRVSLLRRWLHRSSTTTSTPSSSASSAAGGAGLTPSASGRSLYSPIPRLSTTFSSKR